MQNTYSIYMHKNKINNKVYIGQTSGKHPITKEPLHWRYVDEKEPDATVTINYGE